MIVAVDVGYRDKSATAAGVVFTRWDCDAPCRELRVKIDAVADYIPGQFYQRELPCIRVVLDRLDATIDVIVIDGFVHLGAERKPGLGYHLWCALGGKTVVIGVAKSWYKGTPQDTALHRGNSQRPLYVTAAGVPFEQAKRFISRMHGPYRIPTLLKRVDTLCRT